MIEEITLEEEVKSTSHFHRQGIFSDKENTITANEILELVKEECPHSKLTLSAIQHWLETCRATKGLNQEPLVYIAECDAGGNLFTGYITYEYSN